MKRERINNQTLSVAEPQNHRTTETAVFKISLPWIYVSINSFEDGAEGNVNIRDARSSLANVQAESSRKNFRLGRQQCSSHDDLIGCFHTYYERFARSALHHLSLGIGGRGEVKDRKWKNKAGTGTHFQLLGIQSHLISRSYIITSSAASLAALALRRSSACCLSSPTSFVVFT